MPRTLIKTRLHSNKHKRKIKQEVNNTKSNLPPHLQSCKQKNRNLYQVMVSLNINIFLSYK